MAKISANLLSILGLTSVAISGLLSFSVNAAVAQDSAFTHFPASQENTDEEELFVWPELNENTISDRRISAIVSDAKSAAKEAKNRSIEAKQFANQAKNRRWLQNSVGIKPVVAIIDDDTQITATRGSVDGVELGSITYATGAKMIGGFGPDLGIYTGRKEAPLLQFTGWVWGARSNAAVPIEGKFEWKNGDIFTGDITGDGSRGNGIYQKAGGEFRFVGIVDFSHQPFQPVAGIVENKSGRLYAVVFE